MGLFSRWKWSKRKQTLHRASWHLVLVNKGEMDLRGAQKSRFERSLPAPLDTRVKAAARAIACLSTCIGLAQPMTGANQMIRLELEHEIKPKRLCFLAVGAVGGLVDRHGTRSRKSGRQLRRHRGGCFLGK